MIGTRKRERGWGLRVDFYKKFKVILGVKNWGKKYFTCVCKKHVFYLKKKKCKSVMRNN